MRETLDCNPPDECRLLTTLLPHDRTGRCYDGDTKSGRGAIYAPGGHLRPDVDLIEEKLNRSRVRRASVRGVDDDIGDNSLFDPFAFIAEKRLGDKVITFADSTLYSEFYVLNARPEQIEKFPEKIEALLRGLVRAAKFIEENPELSKQILQTYTKLDRDVIDGIWKNFSFKPALVQKLIDYWNAQAIWAHETGQVTPDTQVPDFRKIVDDRFLKKMKPDAVQL